MTVFISSFQFVFISYICISVSSLIAMPMISKTMLNKSGYGEYSCFFLVKEHTFRFPPQGCLLWVCHLWPIFCWGEFCLCLSGPVFFLSWIGIEFCQKNFLHLLRWLYDFYSLIGWCGISHWLICGCWKKSFHPGTKSTRSVVYDPFNVLWILFPSILLRIFCLCSSVILT